MKLPGFAAECTCSSYVAPAPAAVDLYLLPVEHSAANPPATTADADRWDRQIDGWTMDAQLLHRSCTTYYVGSVRNITQQNSDKSVTYTLQQSSSSDFHQTPTLQLRMKQSQIATTSKHFKLDFYQHAILTYTKWLYCYWCSFIVINWLVIRTASILIHSR